jgi:hypothetical protein
LSFFFFLSFLSFLLLCCTAPDFRPERTGIAGASAGSCCRGARARPSSSSPSSFYDRKRNRSLSQSQSQTTSFHGPAFSYPPCPSYSSSAPGKW